MGTIHAKTSRPYDIVIGQGILGQCGDAVKELFPEGQTVIVTDDNVEPLYLETLKRSFQRCEIECVAFIIPNVILNVVCFVLLPKLFTSMPSLETAWLRFDYGVGFIFFINLICFTFFIFF